MILNHKLNGVVDLRMKIMIDFLTQLLLEHKLLIAFLIASSVLCTNDSSSDHYHHHKDTTNHHQGKDDWDFVKYLRLNNSNYGNCEMACRNDPYCIKWQLTINDLSNHRTTDLSVPLTVVESYQHHHRDLQSNISGSTALDCLLLSNTMVQLMDRLDGHIHNTASCNNSSSSGDSSSVISEDLRNYNSCYTNDSYHSHCSRISGDNVASSNAPLMIEGTKVLPFYDRHRRQQRPMHDNQKPIIANTNSIYFEDDGRARLRRLLKGPVSADVSTILNFDEHMVRGCSYTISMWLWLWRPNAKKHRNVAKLILRVSDKGMTTDDGKPLTFHIVTNIDDVTSSRQDYMLLRLDNYDGISPSTTWLSEVRYLEWMHLTVSHLLLSHLPVSHLPLSHRNFTLLVTLSCTVSPYTVK